MHKHCPQCQIEHPLTKDYWFRLNASPMCKQYYRVKRKENYQKNKCKEKIKQAEYLKRNYEKIQQYQKGYRQANKLKRNKYSITRRKLDVQYRLSCNLRSRLTKAVKGAHGISSIRHLGCSVKELRIYLENKFQPGMTWENYGTAWHVDHIYPLSKVDLTTQEELIKVCHYTNLQPLWALDNVRKYNKLPSEIIYTLQGSIN